MRKYMASFNHKLLKFESADRLEGPAVRSNLNEVHFNNPHFIDTMYAAGGRKTNKPIMLGQRTGSRYYTPRKCHLKLIGCLFLAPNSIVAAVDHNLHRMRRNSINGFFSDASIRRVEPIIKEKLEKMLARWNEPSGADSKILNMRPVFKAYASDIITTYAFGDYFHFLDEDNWGIAYFSSTDKYFSLTHVFGHFPVVMTIVTTCPLGLYGYSSPT